jgi:AcrR family transcriptional regulator
MGAGPQDGVGRPSRISIQNDEVTVVKGSSADVESIGDAAKTTKGVRRRAEIMAAATSLFRERGFRATSLDDIGRLAGVSGPAIYRYFKSKHELLSVLVEEAAITWRVTVDDVLNRDTPPLVTLENLIDAAVVLQLQNGTLRTVYQQEFRLLDEDDRRRVARIDRVTMAEWVHLLCEVRPGITDEEARAAVMMVDGLLRSVSSIHTSMDRERLAAVMRDMAMGSLLALGGPRAVVVASA